MNEIRPPGIGAADVRIQNDSPGAAVTPASPQAQKVSPATPPGAEAGRDQDVTHFPPAPEAPLDWGSLSEARIDKWVKAALKHVAPEAQKLSDIVAPDALRLVNEVVCRLLLREEHSPAYERLAFPLRCDTEDIAMRFRSQAVPFPSTGVLMTLLDRYKQVRIARTEAPDWKADVAFVQRLLNEGPELDPAKLL